MKIINYASILIVLLFISVLAAYSQESSNTNLSIAVVKIKTTAQCGMCKDKIESRLSEVEGISKAALDEESKECTVEYDSTKISSDDIRKEIASTGYDADDVKASKTAYNKLPNCCKLPEEK